jgi:oligopeptide transport system ATP-binding protein
MSQSTRPGVNAAPEETLLSVRDLKMHFPGPARGLPWQGHAVLRAVDGVDLDVPRGRTLGLVGESGCGKSSLARSILQLTRPTAGQVLFEGRDLCKLKPNELRPVRRRMQIIFQDPYASLDPRCTIGFTVGEGLLIHRLVEPKLLRQRVGELLLLVGLNPAFENRYPHEFSGGQRQRVGIARALATDPTFVVGDEPLSALDVSIQAQIINLLRDLKARLSLTLLFISHDLRAVRYLSDEVAVMYLGKIVEIAPTDRLFQAPQHPYTQALLLSVPKPRWAPAGAAAQIKGEVPSPLDPPPGCAFSTRCPHAMPICLESAPALTEVQPGHRAACFLLSR